MLEAYAFIGMLNEPDVEWLVANSKRQEIPSGSVIIRQGEPVGSLYLIVSGAFDVVVSIPQQHRVARLYRGELVGEMSFVDMRPPSATVTAAGDSSALAIAKDDLTRKLDADSAFAARFYRAVSLLLSGRLRAAFAEKLDLDAGPEDESEMSILKARFEEVERRLELRRSAQGAGD
jgi:CRP-like cAMP-binding protein